MEKILIVGAGATGSLAASMLARKAQLSLTVWDKGGGGGGRMTTRRNVSDHQIDLGAQYITRFCKDGGCHSTAVEQLKDRIFDELVSDNVLVPFTGVIEGEMKHDSINYVCPEGMSNVPKHFLQQSKANCLFRRQLKTVNINPATNQITCGWSQDGSNGSETFDGLILTLPVPQLLNLEGNMIESIHKQDLDNLRTVEYSSRYAMGLGFDTPIPHTSWTGKYFNHPIIRYACWDNLKRGQSTSKPSLLVHTSVPFGLQHLEDDKDAVSRMVTEALPEVIPGLPTPSYSYIIRWRYSQVFKPYPGSPGCVVLHVNPLVIATGDAFNHSNLEGCITAANSTVETLLNQ